MLEFVYKNKHIPLEKSSSVRIISINPACFHDSIPGNKGLGIEIPVNSYSKTIFGRPERFEKYSFGSDRRYPDFEIRFSGALLERGTLLMTGANSDLYTGWLKSEIGVLGDEYREKFIDEMKWKQGTVFINKNIYSYPTDEFTAPTIKNPAFWEEKGKQIPDKIHYRDEDGEWQKREEKIGKLVKAHRDNFGFLINNKQDGLIKTTGEGCVVSPMLFLNYVLKEMFRTNKWFIDRNDLHDNWAMRQLLIYNNFNITKPTFSLEEKPFNWSWDEETQDFIETNWQTIAHTSWDIDSFNYKDLIPRVSLKDFLLGLQNFLNYVFVFKNNHKVDIIDRNAIPDSEIIDLDNWFVSEWEINERENFKLKFISEYDKNDGIQGDNWHDLSDRIYDFKDPVQAYDELLAIENPQIGDLRLVIEENKIYEWKWAVDTAITELRYEFQEDVLKWEFVSTGPQHFFYGDADSIEEIKTKFSTLLKFFKVFEMDSLSIPIVEQRGNIDIMRSLWNDFSLRLLFNNTLTGAATDEYAGYSLQWDGENGLFNKRWKKWSRFWKNRLPVEAKFNLSLNIIDYIRMNIHKRFRTRHGTFLIEEMSTNFELNKIGITTIKGYKI